MRCRSVLGWRRPPLVPGCPRAAGQGQKRHRGFAGHGSSHRRPAGIVSPCSLWRKLGRARGRAPPRLEVEPVRGAGIVSPGSLWRKLGPARGRHPPRLEVEPVAGCGDCSPGSLWRKLGPARGRHPPRLEVEPVRGAGIVSSSAMPEAGPSRRRRRISRRPGLGRIKTMLVPVGHGCSSSRRCWRRWWSLGCRRGPSCRV